MNGKEKVNAWLDEHADETVEFLRELLRIPSVNPYFEDEDSLKREEKGIPETVRQSITPGEADRGRAGTLKAG